MATTTKKSTKSTGSSTTKKKTELTPYQKEQLEIYKKIQEFKLAAEASAVAILYKCPDKITEVSLTLDDISNNCWKVYYAIAYGVIITENKGVLSDVNIGFFLEKHPKLSKEYEKLGGFEMIQNAAAYVDESSLEGYVQEIKKWNAVTKLVKYGFPVTEARLKEYVDMSAEDIYKELEIYLNDIFVNVDRTITSYNGFEGMEKLVEELDKGAGVGIPFASCNYLNKETGGMIPGEIIGMGASTGVGKSTLAINYIFPSMVKYNLKALFIINEEDQTKFMKEAMIWYLTNIEKSSVPKHVLRDGNYTPEVKELLLKAARWFDAQKENRNITVIPLETYTASMVCRLLKKYTQLGCDVICLDTLKESSDSRGEETWKALMRDTVDFYNIIKKSKTAMIITYQLTKNRSRYLTVADINASKGIVDVFALNLFFRRPLQDEYDGEKRELICTKLSGKSRVNFKLRTDKHYMICFINKNRRGNSDIQIISEADFSINKFEDLGYCVVQQDF